MAHRDRTYDKSAGIPDSRDPLPLPTVQSSSGDLDTPLGDTPARDPWAAWRERIEDLLHAGGCSDQTNSFLESLDDQLTNKGWLSEAQQEAIEKIEGRRDGGRSRY